VGAAARWCHARGARYNGSVNRRRFLSTAAAGLVVAASAERRLARAASKPNVVLIVADDLGYADLSCYGSKAVKTPALDAFAKSGLRLTAFYAAAPVCSPSRAALLTGRYPWRAGVYNYVAPKAKVHLRTNETTLAESLDAVGYTCAHFGKWHLSSTLDGSQPTPGDHGFSYWFATENNAAPSHENPNNFYRNGKKVGPLQGYACQLVVDDALAWLAAHPSKTPFFLNVWFQEPHDPYGAPADLVARHAGDKQPQYEACIENMDDAIGRFLQSLDKLGLAENTVVVFCSDNGSRWANGASPYRGLKGSVLEGGIRVPGIVRWPGHVTAGSESDVTASGIDIMPTVVEIAGGRPPVGGPFDGSSWSPLFAGQPVARPRPLCWYHYLGDPSLCVREGKWSLLGYLDPPYGSHDSAFGPTQMQFVKSSKLGRMELYDVVADTHQKVDVLAQNAEVATRLGDAMRVHHAEIVTSPDWFAKP
jgi:arylsulfatase A